MNYKDYLNSDHWQGVKKNYYKKKGRKCRICDKESTLQIHHRRYKDRTGSILGREQTYELYALCNSCHKTWHNYHGMKKLTISLINRIKRLMALGIVKSKSIELCTQGEFCRTLFNKLEKRSSSGRLSVAVPTTAAVKGNGLPNTDRKSSA